MKRMFGAVLCVLIVFVSCRDRTRNPQKPQKDVEKSSSAYIESMILQDGNKTLGFSIAEGDEATAILTLPCDHGVNLTALTPKIGLSKGATVSPASGVAQDFSGGKVVKYTVVAENGKTKVYIVKVRVLPERRDLTDIKIMICGTPVANGRVTVSPDVSIITKKDVKISFTGEFAPTDFSMSVPKISLKKKGDKAEVQFSTEATYAWKAWKSEKIEVVRGGSAEGLSSEKKILTFKVGDASGVIDETTSPKTIKCLVPDSTRLKAIAPSITCSHGCVVLPESGKLKDFTNSATTPVVYTVGAEDGTKETYNVTVRHFFHTTKFGSFKVGSVQGVIDNEKHTIDVVLPATTPLNAIAPIFEVQDGATVMPASGVAMDFSASHATPFRYEVTAEDGTTKVVYQVRVHHPSHEASIKKIKVGNDEATVSAGNNIRLEVEKSFNLSSLTPVVTVSRGATYSPTGSVNFSASHATPVEYTVTAEDGVTQVKFNVTIVHKKSTEARMKSFKWGTVSAIIAKRPSANNHYRVVMYVGHDTATLNGVIPTIEFSQDATIAPLPSVPQNFSARQVVIYTVTAEDGTTQTQYDVQIMKMPDKSHVKVHGVPANEVKIGNKNVMKVTLPADKTKVKVENLLVYHNDPSSPIEVSKLYLKKWKSQNETERVNEVDLKPTGQTWFKIGLDMGGDFMPDAEMDICVER